MRVDAAQLCGELQEKVASRDPSFELAVECQNLVEMINGELAEQLAEYSNPHVVAAGGSGIVLVAHSARSKNLRALKFPRHHVLHPPKDAPPQPTVSTEREIMERLAHQNIIPLFDAFPVAGGVAEVLVTAYIPDAINLSKYVKLYVCDKECRDDPQMFQERLLDLARLVYQAAGAIAYLHDEVGILHFDVKPDNILIGANRHLYLTDFGLAQPLKPPGQADIQVGFTWKYAHPKLRNTDLKLHISDPRRVRNTLNPRDFSPAIDLFAFGRTLQELLCLIEVDHGSRSHAQYVFDYLHMVAALCLDGQNSEAQSVPGADRTFVEDMPQALSARIFQAHKFTSMQNVLTPLERLLGLRRLEDELPELNTQTSATINVSNLGPTTLTPRVEEIINHPSMRRLKSERQLGMIETIYPTATHTRFEHSLGVYHNVREYIRALYHDPENPTFRILFTEEQGRILLLAALLHDLGQTSFGHDIEEVESLSPGTGSFKTYNHLAFGLSLLHSPAYLEDASQDPLSKVIARPCAQGGWGLDEAQVANFLAEEPTTPFAHVLKEILDGPVDADKLDYLLRDSENCRVRYGQGMDCPRFLRSLTTVGYGPDAIRLAIKRKGAASAEDILITRYQMYQSVYWHHTFRAVKAMFTEAASLALADLRAGVTQGSFEESQAYYEFVLEQRPVEGKLKNGRAKKGSTDPNLGQRLRSLLNDEENDPPIRCRWSSDRTILYLWRISSKPTATVHPCPWDVSAPDRLREELQAWHQGKARQLLLDLLRRNYYRRVLEVPVLEYDENSKDILKRIAGWERSAFSWRVTRALLRVISKQVQDLGAYPNSSVAFDQLDDKVKGYIANKVPVVIDVPPARSWTESRRGYEILFVDDYKRRYFRSSGPYQGASEAHWNETLPKMMKGIANFRVFCEPNLHRVLTRVARTEDIVKAIEDELHLTRIRR